MKNFETLDRQIEILKNRGLVINDVNKAKQYLLTNNYYTIINGYSKFFMDSGENIYYKNTNFDEITNLYFFDKEIKFAMFRAITEAENHVKSIMAHRFSEKYSSNHYAYLDINSYDQSKVLDLGWLISQLSRILNDKKKMKSSNSIKHYLENHGDVPMWVLIDYLDFGQMLTLIKNFPDDLQNKIAHSMTTFLSDNFELKTPYTASIMISMANNIREVRNVCAHNNRLLGFNCKADSKYFKDLHHPLSIEVDSKRVTVYSVFVSLQCFLSRIQYAQLHNTLIKRFRVLENHLVTININAILNSLGFPNEWHNISNKIQH